MMAACPEDNPPVKKSRSRSPRPLVRSSMPVVTAARLLADPGPFVVSFVMTDGTAFTLGEGGHTNSWFLIQSTFKPLVYAMALEKLGSDSVHRSVGSVGGLGYGSFQVLPDGRAPNPLINAGALTLLERLKRDHTEKEIAEFCCTLGDSNLLKAHEAMGASGGTERWYDNQAVTATEADSLRNRGLCCYLATRSATGLSEILPKTERAVDAAVRLYCVADCLKTNTVHLAKMAAIFANGGQTVAASERDQPQRLLSSQTVSMTLSQMLSAGMYEASGDWSREVGIPAKSGVSGAIMCVVPSVAGIGIYSARIDQEGNSVRGMHFVRELVRQVPELSIFFTH